MLLLVYGLSVTAAMSQTAPQCAAGCACTDRADDSSPLADAPGGANTEDEEVAIYDPETGDVAEVVVIDGTGQPDNSAGNNGGILGAADRHADAVAVRNSAYNRQITKQNDDAPLMTCFDRALGLTSRLGLMFSDKAPEWSVPAANTQVFGSVSHPDIGLRVTLGNALRETITDSVLGISPSFADSLSYALSDGPIDAISTWVYDGLYDLIDTLMEPIDQLGEIIAQFNDYVGDIYRYFEMFNIVFPIAIQGLVGSINAIWQMINEYIDTAISTVMNFINTLINNIQNFINSAVTSILEHVTGPDGECARFSKLWGNGFPEDFRGLTGTGTERGAPYMTVLSMIGGAVRGLGGDDPGQYLLQEINNAANSGILRRALEDISEGDNGVLARPGTERNRHYWPALPTDGVIGYRTATVRELVNCMRATGGSC